jgi:hypothetical protein
MTFRTMDEQVLCRPGRGRISLRTTKARIVSQSHDAAAGRPGRTDSDCLAASTSLYAALSGEQRGRRKQEAKRRRC